MSIYYQEKVTGVGGATIISANRANLARFRVEAGTIQSFDVWRDNFSPGSPVTFQLRINGVAQFITPPVLLTDSEHIGVTGLSLATADGDVVSIDASFEGSTEFGFRFPAYFRIGFDQAAASVSDAAYNATTWDGVTTTAPSKNAVRDKFEAVVASIAALVDDTAYDATTWNGATGVAPSKNAVRDKFESVIAYVDSAVTGLLDDRGNYNASGNVFPSSGGSGAAGAVLKGDLWTISVAGTLGGVAVEIGDVIRAIVDTPGNTLANWAITEHNFSYVPENSANKSSSISGDTGSTTKYPTVAAVETHTATKVSDTVYGSGWNGDTTTAPSKNAVYDKIETLSSGGGGSAEPTGVLAPRRTPNAMDDEFEGNSLDTVKWTRTGTAGPVESYDDILRSAIFCRFTNASGTEGLFLAQSFVPGSADFSLSLCGMLELKGNFNDLGLRIEDTGGTNQLQIEWVFGSSRKITYWKNVGGTQTFDIVVATPPNNDTSTIGANPHIILHLQRVSGTYSLWYSYDAVHWFSLQTSHTQTITVGKVIIALGQGGASNKIFGAFHWFRKDWLFLS